MEIKDIHTHNKFAGVNALINLEHSVLLNDKPETIKTDNLPIHYSVGLHPWYLENVEIQKRAFLHLVEKAYAIGECGLDRRCTTNYDLQESIYRWQLEQASLWNKPLIIHCVHAFDDILRLAKQFPPSTSAPHIIHGFRGKPQLASQLIKAGFSLSFGEHFNSESVRLCPTEKLYTETDESPLSIDEITENIKMHRLKE